MYQTTFSLMGLVGLSNGTSGQTTAAVQQTNSIIGSTTSALSWASDTHSSVAYEKPEVSTTTTAAATPAEEDSMSERIGKIAEENRGTNIDDISPEERQRQKQIPRNPKKRMHEEDIDVNEKKDEL